MAQVLRLQRSVGNRAVRQMLARWWDESGTFRDDPKPDNYVMFIQDGQQRWRAPAAVAVAAPVTTPVVATPTVATPTVATPAATGPAKLKIRAKDSHYGRWAAKQKPSVIVADKEIELPAGAPTITNTGTEWRIDPALVNYSQKTISKTFTKSTPSGAITLEAGYTALIAGKDKIGNAPTIRLCMSPNGQIVTLDNRRIYLAKRYATEKQRLKLAYDKPRVRWATLAEYKEEYWKFTANPSARDEGKASIKKI